MLALIDLLRKLKLLPFVVAIAIIGILIVLKQPLKELLPKANRGLVDTYFPWVLLGILVIAALVTLAQIVESRRKKQATEKVLRQAGPTPSTAPSPRTNAARAMERKLQQGLDFLKGHGHPWWAFWRRFFDSDPLARSPWFLVLGPAKSGKSSLIRNCGLTMAVPSGSLGHPDRRIETEYFDYWITSEAVLLEIEGRYLGEGDEEETSAEWRDFLRILTRRHRPYPLNGVVLTLSIGDLTSRRGSQLVELARRTRDRIDALLSTCRLEVPVYLVFTSADRLPGFAEYVADLKPEDRPQIWGETFSAERIARGEAPSLVGEALAHLHANLSTARTAKLLKAVTQEHRDNIFMFPVEFAGLRDRLIGFTAELFRPDPLHRRPHPPTLRGIYFTSTEQGQAVIEGASAKVIKTMGLTTHFAAPKRRESEQKVYFTSRLFRQAFLPAAWQVQPVDRHGNPVVPKPLAAMGMTAAFALLLVWGYWSYAANDAFFKTVGKAPVPTTALSEGFKNEELKTRIRQMENLRAKLDELKGGRLLGRLVYAGSGDVARLASRKYIEGIKASYLVPLGRHMEKELQSGNRSVILAGFYAGLATKVGDESGVSSWERGDWEGLVKYMTEEWLKGRYSTDEAMLRRQFDMLRRVLESGNGDRSLIQGNPTAIKTCNDILGGESNLESRMDSMLQKAGEGLPPFPDWTTIPDADALFASKPQIPGEFTRKGWDAFARIATGKEDPDANYISRARRAGSGPNPPKIEPGRMVELYAEKYIDRWFRFFDALELSPWTDLQHAQEGSRRIAAPGSPLRRMLELTPDELPPADGDFQEQLQALHAEFRPILALMEESEDKPGGEVAELMNRWKGVQTALAALGEGDEAGERAAAILADPESPSHRALKDLEDYCNQWAYGSTSRLGEPLRELFAAPARMTREVLVGSSVSYIDQQWREEVYEPFAEALADRFPFAPGGQDADLAAVEDFFRPDTGYFWTAVTRLPFMQKRPTGWEPVENAPVGPRFRESLRQAETITQALFSPSTEFGLKLEVKPEPPEGTSVSRVSFEMSGADPLSYDLGQYRPTRTFEWPGDAPERGAGVIVESRNAQHPREFTGEWGVFKLMQAGTLVGTDKFSWLVPLGGGDSPARAVFRIRVLRGGPSFDWRLFESFRCAPAVST